MIQRLCTKKQGEGFFVSENVKKNAFVYVVDIQPEVGRPRDPSEAPPAFQSTLMMVHSQNIHEVNVSSKRDRLAYNSVKAASQPSILRAFN